MKRKTIKFDELERLSFVNSSKLPSLIEIHDKRMRWVGIGWVDEGEPQGNEVLVIDSCRGT